MKKILLPTRLRLALEFALYALLTAFALHATWLTWPDAVIDFSRELYLPWRVSLGDVLYRDLAYYFGPLSVYANATLFALLGRPSIHALFALNFAFWIATLLALRALLRRIAPPAVATIAVSVFILLFSFNRYIFCGNFNYLAPYSHELPRGFLFALLALLFLDSALRRRTVPLALLAGILLGLTLFTKPEVALAATSSSAILLFVSLRERGRPARKGGLEAEPPSVSLLVCLACGILLAFAAVLLPLSLALDSFSQAIRDGLLKLYLDCFNPALASLPYFKNVAGTDYPLHHVLRLLLGTVFAVAPFLLDRFVLHRLPDRLLRRAATALLALASAAIGWVAFFPLNAALPLAPVLFAAWAVWGCGRPARSGASGTPPSVCPPPSSLPPLSLAFATFALALVSKIVLAAHIWHYGFVLALPAFCCAVLLAFRPPCPASRAIVAAALLLGFSAGAFFNQYSTLRRWDIRHPVHDSSVIAPRHDANSFNAALDWIRTNTAPGSTLAVLPEGAILNVLSGCPNPTPYVSIPDTDWPRYDEAAILAAYSNSPPDTLVLVRKPQYAQFGFDYAQSLMSLLDPLYTPALTLTLSSGSIPYLLVATRTNPSTSKP